ncbi:unnamed protein product [Rhizophagus irregularis]|nr:unnamed protein product [Rhizophagus irregularis]
MRNVISLSSKVQKKYKTVKKYPTGNHAFLTLYGISQNPDTNNYILVLKHLMWISGNEKIDDFIQEKQFKVKDHNDVVFEWIPYDQFGQINIIGKSGLMTLYSAIWWKGPLCYQNHRCIRESNQKVTLKFLHNSQNSIEFVINEVWNFINAINISF